MLLLGALAALLAGFSKTGVPGSGILIVPMMAAIFGGRLSVGATLPL
ncbi:sulfite exporter TauE/SafE family protein, partial [bacterium]